MIKTKTSMTRIKKALVVPKKIKTAVEHESVVHEAIVKVAKHNKEPIVSAVKLGKKIQTAEGWKRSILHAQKKVKKG